MHYIDAHSESASDNVDRKPLSVLSLGLFRRATLVLHVSYCGTPHCRSSCRRRHLPGTTLQQAQMQARAAAAAKAPAHILHIGSVAGGSATADAADAVG